MSWNWQTRDFQGMKNSGLVSIVVVVWLAAVPLVFGSDSGFGSKWDEEILKVEFQNVRIEGSWLEDAWYKVGSTVMLRSCLYHNVRSDSDATNFVFRRAVATGREVMDAFLAAYPEYTLTQDPKTGIIWIHRKEVRYEDIFSDKVKTGRSVEQVPVWDSVIAPLGDLLATHVGVLPSPPNGPPSRFVADLPAGEYSFRDVLNLCLVQNPILCFEVSPITDSPFKVYLRYRQLVYMNPLAPPRMGAIAFWNSIMRTNAATNAPTLEEVAAALSDPDPRKRWAGGSMLAMEYRNYVVGGTFFKETTDPTKKVWELFGLYPRIVPQGPVLLRDMKPAVIDALPKLNPGLSLIARMWLVAISGDPEPLNAVAGQRISGAEFASVRPEFFRIAWISKPVRDKLAQMDFAAPELKAAVMSELQNTNALFSLAPASGH